MTESVTPNSGTPRTQLEWWNHAVELLGGKRATAALLGINERNMRFLCAGDSSRGVRLHEGYLRDISAALLAHAKACTAAERALSPDFAGNLTADQRRRVLTERPKSIRRPADTKED